MRNQILLTAFILLLLACPSFMIAQENDPKKMHETAKNFMRTGDFDNAIIVLTRALQYDPKDLEMQKDLTMSYYMKRDYLRALEGAKTLVGRDDADVVCFQIAGNVYKAIEEVKECEKIYKKGLKKFPKSGPLYSEYGELLWSAKDFSAINQWEQGIRSDPAYGGNYYNAAQYYFYTKDKVWSLVYAEIFINMESMSERGAAMKQLLLQGYKEKLFAEADLLGGVVNIKNEFEKAFLSCMARQSPLANSGINTGVLTMIRTRFILDWFNLYAAKFPYKLFDFQRQLLKDGLFDAYNQWLFGSTENLAAFESWTRAHSEEQQKFTAFQKTRVFRMPPGQHYSQQEQKK